MLRETETRLRLPEDNIAPEAKFQSWVDTPEDDAPVLLAAFTAIDSTRPSPSPPPRGWAAASSPSPNPCTSLKSSATGCAGTSSTCSADGPAGN